MFRKRNKAENQSGSNTLRRLEASQARLVVSIPALMLAYTELLAVILHMNLIEMAEAMPVGEAREQAFQLADMVLLLGTGGAIAAGGVGVLLAWQIVRPLRQMTANMRRVAEGDLSSQAHVAQLGEIGVLGSTFNEMVDGLRDLFQRRDRQMRESASGSVFSIGRDGTVLAVDSDVTDILGVSVEDLFGRRISDVLSPYVMDAGPDLTEIFERQLHDAVEGRTSTATMDLRLPGHEGPAFYSFTIHPLRQSAPNKSSFLLQMRDLTAMREFYHQMRRADQLAALGTLAAGIAHEIRNPLASIRGMVQLLREDEGTSEQADEFSNQYVHRIECEIERLNRLVTSIMDFANIKEDLVKPVDLNAMLLDVAENCRLGTGEEQIASLTVEWDLDTDLPPCPLEPERMRQALINLVQNAFEEVIKDGGGEIRFVTRLLSEGFQRPVVLAIANSGTIPKDSRERLFQPFFTTKDDGTGLGLPITYQIVTANNGIVEVFTESGMVEFQVRLPLEGMYAQIPRTGSGSATRVEMLGPIAIESDHPTTPTGTP